MAAEGAQVYVFHDMHTMCGAQVSFAAQLDSFLTQVRKQREQLLDVSADVQLQVDSAVAPMYDLNRCTCSGTAWIVSPNAAAKLVHQPASSVRHR